MSTSVPANAQGATPADTLTALFYLSMLLVIAAILTAAMAYQYGNSEIPCPLCLLQRVALFGVCFGLIQNFRSGFSDRNTGFSLLFTVFLLIVSVRQTLLNIYPRPGHAYVGSAVFGIHMPVWCVLIAVALLAAFAVKLALLGGDSGRDNRQVPAPIAQLATIAGLYVVVLCVINFASVVLQCGLDACHTYEYRLLK